MARTSAKIILWKQGLTKSGYPIKIRVQNGTAKYVNLYRYSKAEHWKDGPLPSHPQYSTLNIEIIHRQSQLLKEVAYCNENNLGLEDSIKIVKNGISENVELEIFMLEQKISKLRKQGGVGLLEFYDTRIKEISIENRSIRAYKQCREVYFNYLQGKDVTLNDVTYEFLNDFIQFQRSGGCGVPGINYYLGNLRSVYKEAQRRTSLGIKQDNPFLGLIKKAPKKEKPLPTTSELKKLWDYSPTKSTTKLNAFKTRRNIAIFKLQILIGGQDYVELALLKWKDLKGGRIKIYRHKNRNKAGNVLIDNLLNPEALDIIETYGEKGERVFPFIPNPEVDEDAYFDFSKNVRRSLRTAFERMGVNCYVGTKSPRYIYRSVAGELLIDTLSVMQLQGHKADGISAIYQRRIPNDIIDKLHLKILESAL